MSSLGYNEFTIVLGAQEFHIHSNEKLHRDKGQTGFRELQDLVKYHLSTWTLVLHQAITWTNVDLLSIVRSGTNFSGIRTKYKTVIHKNTFENVDCEMTIFPGGGGTQYWLIVNSTHRNILKRNLLSIHTFLFKKIQSAISPAKWWPRCAGPHYNDVIMGTIASQIISLTIVNSAVYSGADKRKHQSSASLAFVRGIQRGPVNSPHKWPVTRKMFPFDDVIMHCGKLRGISLHVMVNTIYSCHWILLSYFTIVLKYNLTLNCGPVTPNGDKDLGQYCLMWWHVGWRHQAIAWTNAEFSPVKFGSIRMRTISQGVHSLLFYIMSLKIILLTVPPHLPMASELNSTDSMSVLVSVFDIEQWCQSLLVYVKSKWYLIGI